MTGIGLVERIGLVTVGHRHSTVVVAHIRVRRIGHVAAVTTGQRRSHLNGLTGVRIAKLYFAVGEHLPCEAGILRTAIDGQRFVALVVEHA